jgi:hypothetical protein
VTVFNPLLAAVAPGFHSLQYLAIVWRYQFNVERARGHGRGFSTRGLGRVLGGPGAGLALFVVAGTLLGAMLFWAIPFAISAQFGFANSPLGAGAPVFAVWVFVNIHHYFIDNVIWRRENPDTRQHLFG